MTKLIEIKNLRVHFDVDEGTAKAVDGVSFDIGENRVLGVIGESGCGKSVTAHSILRIVPSPPARMAGGQILFHPRSNGGVQAPPVDLLTLDPKGEDIRKIRGKEIGMIFQEPMTSFGPLHTIGDQIMETIITHDRTSKAEARTRTIELLRRVGIPNPEKWVDDYPHKFSGGMRQRAMIAMALSCSPRLLIADEPTTAIDVTVQAQILELLRELKEATGMAILLITHNLAVVSELADEIVVMYMGRVMERAPAEELFNNPLHPYTIGLLHSIPVLDGPVVRLEQIKGSVPSPCALPDGCVFHPRCDKCRQGVCDGQEVPELKEISPGHWVSCFPQPGGRGL
jgi:peptide/nickel transport system ATP-binding protein